MGAEASGAARGRLFVVATPIGNLGDITLRALEALRSVDVIAAEDTRVTARLLTRHDIRARTVSYHARNAATRGPELLARLSAGENVALVTDAGTPGISDPGADLVRAWAKQGGLVVPIPGASSALAAISATGITGPRWAFEGFLPRSGRERRERLAGLAAEGRGAVLFEAPSRLAVTLRDLVTVCGRERPGAVCRELTKLHEEIVHGSLGELADLAAAGGFDPRGELVIVLGERRGQSPGPSQPDMGSAKADVDRLVASGIARGEAARRVSAATGIPRRELYRTEAD
jgi:16S rRNA (cytidine1402-2'-O)-methyltransferase